MSEETNASSATESSVKEPAVTAADTQKKVVKKPSIGKYWTTLQKSLNSQPNMYVYPVIIHVYFQQQQKKVVKKPFICKFIMDGSKGGG